MLEMSGLTDFNCAMNLTKILALFSFVFSDPLDCGPDSDLWLIGIF